MVAELQAKEEAEARAKAEAETARIAREAREAQEAREAAILKAKQEAEARAKAEADAAKKAAELKAQQEAEESAKAEVEQAKATLTPRTKAWLGTMALPEDQISKITVALADNLYTSVDIMMDDAKALLELREIQALKAGAKAVLSKNLAKLKDVYRQPPPLSGAQVTVLPAASSSSIPTIHFGELVVEDMPMASGSFKSVYKATWARDGGRGEQQVAVLVLRQGGSAVGEIQIFERLGLHPHLVKLLGLSAKPPTGDLCMVLEFARRGSLDCVLSELADQQQSATHSVLLTAATQVCEAMEVLCQYNIIHRDLAARNVLVFSFHPKI